MEQHQARLGERDAGGSQGTGNGREPFTSCLHFDAHPGFPLFITNVFIEHYQHTQGSAGCQGEGALSFGCGGLNRALKHTLGSDTPEGPSLPSWILWLCPEGFVGSLLAWASVFSFGPWAQQSQAWLWALFPCAQGSQHSPAPQGSICLG